MTNQEEDMVADLLVFTKVIIRWFHKIDFLKDFSQSLSVEFDVCL